MVKARSEPITRQKITGYSLSSGSKESDMKKIRLLSIKQEKDCEDVM